MQDTLGSTHWDTTNDDLSSAARLQRLGSSRGSIPGDGGPAIGLATKQARVAVAVQVSGPAAVQGARAAEQQR